MSSRRHAALAFLATALLALSTSGCGSGINLDEPIEGPNWRLVQLGDEPIAPSSEPQRDAQIQFDVSSGRVTGSGGCNRIFGSFQRSGNTLSIGQLGATRMACTDPVRSVNETSFFAALQSTARYRLQGPSRLILLDASGRAVATLEH